MQRFERIVITLRTLQQQCLSVQGMAVFRFTGEQRLVEFKGLAEFLGAHGQLLASEHRQRAVRQRVAHAVHDHVGGLLQIQLCLNEQPVGDWRDRFVDGLLLRQFRGEFGESRLHG